MINICIKDIVEATKGKLLCGDEKQQIDHLSIDSRSSQGNDLFIPIIGAKVDAHRFIDGAFSVGCVATLTSEHDSMDDPNHAWIRVEDTVPVRYQSEFRYLDTEGNSLDGVKKTIELPEEAQAPVAKGAEAGRAVYLLNGVEIGSVPILYENDVAKAVYKDYLFKIMEFYLL